MIHFSSHLSALLLGEESSRSREHSWSREIHMCVMLNLTEVGFKNDPTRNLRTRKLHANSQFSSIRKKLKVGDSYHDMEHCL